MKHYSGGISGSREPSQSTLSRPVGFDPGRERGAIVSFLRAEADVARFAQGAAQTHTDKLYRMGQKDGLLLAADAIERGHYLFGDA